MDSAEISGDEGSVDLGFIQECTSADLWRLASRFFPSKVGGRPSWLHLSDLPKQDQLQCRKCHKPCVFLCQIYAPIEKRDDCFHRTLFVFMCRNAECCSPNDSSNFVVFRSQLQRDNEFYAYSSPEDRESWQPDVTAEKWTSLCVVCGCHGTSHCGRCKQVMYCCREHQVLHWKEGHKPQCSPESSSKTENVLSSFLLPEFEIVIEREETEQEKHDESGSDSDDGNEAEEKRIKAFEKLKKEGQAGILADDETVNADLLGMAACDEDKAFSAFKSRLALNPGQVLRYERTGKPLWVSGGNVPSDRDIPACSQCGSKRVFEFQILPQLLSHLSLDSLDQSIDWGVLSVYTCVNSCTQGPAYKEEFLWKQDLTM